MRFALEWIKPGIFIFILFVFSLFLETSFLSVLLYLIFIANILFFRDPERDIPSGKGIVVSPADGIVKSVTKTFDHVLNADCVQITIFLNVWNVHINRVPVGGIIEDIIYQPGKFFPAYHKKSKDNEKNKIIIRNSSCKIIFVQSVGILARRIKCWANKNDSVRIGQRIGLMMYGSRADVIIPESCIDVICVKPKDYVSAGETIIAKLKIKKKH